jgi:hypothetical protein
MDTAESQTPANSPWFKSGAEALAVQTLARHLDELQTSRQRPNLSGALKHFVNTPYRFKTLRRDSRL